MSKSGERSQMEYQRKPVLEEYQDWQEVQGRKLQDETLELRGTMDVYQNAMAPISSTRIRQELKKGPPSGLSKAEKKVWREKMGVLQKLALERERFFAPINQIEMVGNDKLKARQKEGRQTVSDYAEVMLETREIAQLNFQDQPVKDMRLLEKHPQIGQLQGIAKKLQKYNPSNITSRRLMDLTLEYKAMNLTVNATSADQLDEAVRFQQSGAGFVFLFHSVVSVLTYYLDRLPMDQINMDYFTKLCGLERVYSRTALQMKNSEDYKTQQREYRAAEERRQAEEEQRNREARENLEARRVYLQTGIYQKNTPEEWVLGPYAQEVEKELGQRFTDPDCTLEEVVDKVSGLEASFLQNRSEIQKQLAAHPAIILPIHKEQLLTLVEKKHFRNLLKPMMAETVSAAIKSAMNDMDAELRRCTQRKEYLDGLDRLKDFTALSPLPDALQDLLLGNNTEDVFKTQADQLEQQTGYNLEVCQNLLDEGLFALNHAQVLQMLRERCAATLLGGTRAEVIATVGHYLNENVLQEHLPEVVQSEKRVHAAMAESGMGQLWKKAIGQTLNPADSQQTMTEKLVSLRKRIEANQDIFEAAMQKKRLRASGWSRLLRWQEEKIGLEEQEFRSGLMKLAEELADASKDALLLREYLEGGQDAAEIRPAAQQNYLEHLKGAQFCQWDGFSGFLQGYEDKAMQALEQVLQKGQLKHPFLEKVAGSADLENLTYVEFQTLLNHLRVNLGKSIRSWHALEGLNADQVRAYLLPEMLCGELDDETFMTRADVVSKQLQDEEKATAFRFRYLLKTGSQAPERLRYQYIDDSDSTALNSKDSRVTRRLKRLDQARKVWGVLDRCNLTQSAVEKVYQVKKSGGDGVRVNVELLTLLRSAKKNRGEAYALIEKLEDMDRKSCDDYVNELFLCGMEAVFLSKENNPKGYEAFTKSNRDIYNAALKETGEIALNRMWQLNRAVETYCEEYDRDWMRKKFSVLAAGLHEGEEEKNFQRFGVKSWEDALYGIHAYLKTRRSLYAHLSVDAILEERTLVQMEHRQEQINSYEKGLLLPVRELLLKNREFWTTMVTGSQTAFTQYLKEIGQRLEVPLGLLDTRYPYGVEFKRQIIDALGEEMISGEEKDRSAWIKLYDDYFDRFCSHRLGGTSIKTQHQELMKKDPELASCFTELLLNHSEGLGMMTDKKKLQAMLQDCKECIKANTKTLEGFIKTKTHLTPGGQAGFRMFLQSKIPFTSPEEFARDLNNWMAEFDALSAVTAEQTIKTQSVMSERAEMMLDVETHRYNGRMADEKADSLLQGLRRQMRGAGSPLLAALGVQKMPDQKQIQKAREKLGKYGQLPQRVKDCLFERLLSGGREREIEQELVWLKRTDALVDAFSLPEHVAAELLTFLYIRHRGTELTPEDVRKEYQELGARHMQIHAMMDEAVALEQEFMPRSWENAEHLSGKREKLLKNWTENPMLKEQRRMMMEAMAVGIYTMEENPFHALASRQSEYFKTAEIADRLFTEVIEEYLEQSTEAQSVRIALAEYFHEDILKGRDYFQKNVDAIRRQARRMLSDPFYCAHLVAEGKMESVGSDSLTEQEKKLHTLASRKTLEQFLGEDGNERFRAAYNRLNRQQRQVFALSVLQIDQINELPSARFVHSKELQANRQTVIQAQLEQYVSRGEFQPEISYDRVMDILRHANGKMDQTAFEAAMELTLRCIRQYQSKGSEDWGRLADGADSIREASRLARPGDAAYGRTAAKPVSSLQEMKHWILEQDSGKAQKQKDRLEQMDDYQLQLLTTVLQDRTMLDDSTRARGKGEKPEFVNTEKRESTRRDILSQKKGMRLYTGNLTQAMNTLLGYQLRDDVELGRRRLNQEDFAPNALKRKTQVDWDLLQRAMDFVEELMRENP